jgi:peptide methionine sulfoxide reductase MsrB
MFMTRTEITCANWFVSAATNAALTDRVSGGHLGHVFKGEGLGVPTDERWDLSDGTKLTVAQTLREWHLTQL